MTEKNDFSERVIESIKESISAKERLLASAETIATIARVSEVMIESLRAGHKLLLFGNGGSAADSQHIAAEFVGRFAFDRPALPALALSVNTSALTAIGNDYGFDQVFSRQIEALGAKGDVAIGISTSGNSPNVLQGLITARKLGLHTVAFTGGSGGKMMGAADYCNLRALQGNSPHSGVPHPDRPCDLTARGARNLS